MTNCTCCRRTGSSCRCSRSVGEYHGGPGAGGGHSGGLNWRALSSSAPSIPRAGKSSSDAADQSRGARRAVDRHGPGHSAVCCRHLAQQVAEAGGYSLDELIRQADRGAAVTAVSKGAVRVVEDLHAARRVDAIAAMGGGAGTTVGTAAMRAAARDSEGDGVHAGERRRAGIRRRQGHRDDPGDRRHQRAEPDQPRRVARAAGPSVECWTPRRTARPRPRMLP